MPTPRTSHQFTEIDTIVGRVAAKGANPGRRVRSRVSDSGVTDMVRGWGQGPCVALLFDSQAGFFAGRRGPPAACCWWTGLLAFSRTPRPRWNTSRMYPKGA